MESLDNGYIFHYNIVAIGVWRSLVSRLVRVQEASGSNPDTPTKNPATTSVVAGFLMCVWAERILFVLKNVQLHPYQIEKSTSRGIF